MFPEVQFCFSNGDEFRKFTVQSISKIAKQTFHKQKKLMQLIRTNTGVKPNSISKTVNMKTANKMFLIYSKKMNTGNTQRQFTFNGQN